MFLFYLQFYNNFLIIYFVICFTCFPVFSFFFFFTTFDSNLVFLFALNFVVMLPFALFFSLSLLLLFTCLFISPVSRDDLIHEYSPLSESSLDLLHLTHHAAFPKSGDLNKNLIQSFSTAAAESALLQSLGPGMDKFTV